MIYSQLVAAVLSFYNDAEIVQTVPTFIALAEAQMNRVLRVREMWGFAVLNIACERAKLPDDFAAVESLKGPHGKLTYVSPQMMDEEDHFCWTPGLPFIHRQTYTIAGGELVFPHLVGPPPAPPPPGAPPSCFQPCAMPARMRYRKRLPPLSAANTTNWLLDTSPDAYVYGALVQSLGFKEDGRGSAWTASYERALADIEEADRHVVADTLEMRSDVNPGHHHHRYGLEAWNG